VSGNHPVGEAMGDIEHRVGSPIKPLGSFPGFEILVCFAVLIGCMAAGAAVCAFGAFVVLQWAEGDARGGEILFLGFAVLIGAAIGGLAGIVTSVLWLRGRRRTWAQ
jgi:cytosine/uracil/thiamine/allantoin permease